MNVFVHDYLIPGLIMLGESLLLIVALLIFVAYILYADRKIWAAVQMRRGPNVVGPFGLLQPFADLLKFVVKEPIVPASANKGIFLLAPLVTAMLALSAWAVMPLAAGVVIADINVGILYIFAVSSLGVYGIIMSGWASNSKYPFLSRLALCRADGVLRGVAGLHPDHCSPPGRLAQPERHRDVADPGYRQPSRPAQYLPRLALAAAPADVRGLLRLGAGRDQPPAIRPIWSRRNSSELVAGFHVEYSSTPFLLFFLGEYVSVLLMCALGTILFLGGWLPPIAVIPFTWVPGIVWFVLKVVCCLLFFMFADGEGVRAALPLTTRLMRLGWKVFLPLSLAMVVVVAIRPADYRLGRCLMSLDQSARALFLQGLSSAPSSCPCATSSGRRRRSTIPSKRARSARAFAASTRSVAIPMARNVASPASCARAICPAQAITIEAGPRRNDGARGARRRYDIDMVKCICTAAFARRPARSMPSSRGRISSSPPKPARTSTSPRRSSLANGDRWEREPRSQYRAGFAVSAIGRRSDGVGRLVPGPCRLA